MSQPNERSPRERDGLTSSHEVPRFILRLATKFEWQHVKGIAVIRFFVALWLLGLSVVFFVIGYWGWGLFLVVAAGLVGWLAYLMPPWKTLLPHDATGERT